MPIQFLKGDATQPAGDGQQVIVHVCNDLGRWGRGFVLALSQRWAEPEQTYKEAFKTEPKPSLGDVQFVSVSDSITVANLIGQHGIRSPRNKNAPAPIRYEAIETGLSTIGSYALKLGASIHMPRIGCGLAGGHWEEIEPIIELTLVNKGVSVFVYSII
ncbi:macro domain-containing protein [Marinibactrum halimedae]|uniref:Appr-1-p processing protein n=1 Tax=Marinibactrum halimedae TaxID=1444977 RepID=A0AA37T849_9GAMM|nr:macro domain-containing protein [Marinibactrum halimedae]MCD9461039.1 macro domain-containing protein [Marinibactrum halimedae]GLS24417.1 Appr-1-p processing protein [Marinibactrum halimedae]